MQRRSIKTLTSYDVKKYLLDNLDLRLRVRHNWPLMDPDTYEPIWVIKRRGKRSLPIRWDEVVELITTSGSHWP